MPKMEIQNVNCTENVFRDRVSGRAPDFTPGMPKGTLDSSELVA